VIEIGAEFGGTTQKLLELVCQQDGVLHTIDPEPQFEVAELERRYPDRFRFYQEKSHDALGRIEPATAVIIDGDHNWYTVFGELTRLREIAEASGVSFPLVMLHDVEWPYARRDMYYDPDSIPAKWRRPWARRGVKWQHPGLGGIDADLNSDLANALEEGGPRNGVLTAVEDFLGDFPDELDFKIVTGLCGLGVLVPVKRLAGSSALRREWQRLDSREFLATHAKRLANLLGMATVENAGLTRRLERLEPAATERSTDPGPAS
jgi:hypothetical protein